MDVTSLGTTSRTLHSATHAPNSPPTSRLSPLFRTLSEMGQAATKLGHGGACVATSKRAPRGIRFCLPAPAKKYPEDVRCRPPPRPRRAKRPARSSLPTRVSRVSTVTARTAARARDERSPASTGNPVRSVSRPSSTPFLSRRVGSRSDYDGSLHDRHLVSSKLSAVWLTLRFPRPFPSARHRGDRMGRPPVRR